MGRSTFHPLAEQELVEAGQFYELESPGLGASFVDEAERCEGAILEFPDAGTPVGHDVRRRLLRVFPYALLYRVRPDGVRILSVMNLRRRPMYWVGRE